MLGREKAAAEERAALAAAEKSESERAAAEQLQGALQRSEDLPEVSNQSNAAAGPLSALQAAWSCSCVRGLGACSAW